MPPPPAHTKAKWIKRRSSKRMSEGRAILMHAVLINALHASN